MVHIEHDSWEWRGGYSAVDFFDQGESYEVKSGYGDPPEAPFFSVDQIEHAISRGEHHHLLTVGLAEDTFDDLFKRANELNREKHKSARIIVPDVAPWVHHLASDVGIPFHLVARVFATDDHFHERLRLLKKKAREVPVEPNPFPTATYEPLRHTIENDLIRGRFQVRLPRAARLIS